MCMTTANNQRMDWVAVPDSKWNIRRTTCIFCCFFKTKKLKLEAQHMFSPTKQNKTWEFKQLFIARHICYPHHRIGQRTNINCCWTQIVTELAIVWKKTFHYLFIFLSLGVVSATGPPVRRALHRQSWMSYQTIQSRAVLPMSTWSHDVCC